MTVLKDKTRPLLATAALAAVSPIAALPCAVALAALAAPSVAAAPPAAANAIADQTCPRSSLGMRSAMPARKSSLSSGKASPVSSDHRLGSFITCSPHATVGGFPGRGVGRGPREMPRAPNADD